MIPIVNERQSSSFAYVKEIQKNFGCLDPIIEWCKKECIADWRWNLVSCSTDQQPGRYIFYFDSERDAVAFNIKWA